MADILLFKCCWAILKIRHVQYFLPINLDQKSVIWSAVVWERKTTNCKLSHFYSLTNRFKRFPHWYTQFFQINCCLDVISMSMTYNGTSDIFNIVIKTSLYIFN